MFAPLSECFGRLPPKFRSICLLSTLKVEEAEAEGQSRVGGAMESRRQRRAVLRGAAEATTQPPLNLSLCARSQSCLVVTSYRSISSPTANIPLDRSSSIALSSALCADAQGKRCCGVQKGDRVERCLCLCVCNCICCFCWSRVTAAADFSERCASAQSG